MAEIVPVGTILAVLTTQVIKTAQAAHDVVFQKESFKVLAKHLSDIEPVLKELQLKKLEDSPAARKALESLETDVRKANDLVDKYKNRARFYLLVKSRHIVKEVQDVTRDIGRSLLALSLANIEVLSGIAEEVNRLQSEMQRAEFETSQSRVQVVDKLNQGLSDQILDREFANDMLRDIAIAVGVPVEPAEISKELDSFKRDIEEAANRKERAEVLFLEQVIELLSRADAARDYEEVRNQYFQRLEVVERYDPKEEYIHPFKAFFCPMTGNVMTDPVSLCTGTTCERAALEAWFDCGEKTDPTTGEILEDSSYRSNLQLRQSIQEWKELNYCAKIRSCKAKLQAEDYSCVEEALDQIQELLGGNSVIKEWISIGGVTKILVSLLSNLQNEVLKLKIITTLKIIVEGHARNKDLLIENQGLRNIVPCLKLHSSVSKAAIELLYEVLLEKSGLNLLYCRTLSQQCDAIPHLVTILKGPDRFSAEKAQEILMKLCDEDEENIIQAAKVDWYGPLVDRLLQGSAPLRLKMVRALIAMDLSEENIKILGKEGVIPPLLEMTSGNIESKEVALSSLVKLSTYGENKKIIAAKGGVPLILELLFTIHIRTIIIAKSAEILENLSSDGDGTKYLVDENGTPINLEPVVTNLLAFQQNLNSSDIVRRPALRALLRICQSEAGLVKLAVLSASGVSVVLPLLDDSSQEIRELAINLLFLFSHHEPEGVVEYLIKPRRLEALVCFLENYDKGDIQMAAAGLLANLPKSEISLTEKLIELGGLKAIINILISGTMEAKENALSALFRFTDPTNLQSQHTVVEHGVIPLLVGSLRASSIVAQARAAALLGDLSMRSLELANASKRSGCWHISWRHDSVCPAHGGVCSVNATFCLLKANALPDLVGLLRGKVHATAYEAIQTLSTLVSEESPQGGASVLHENDAVAPIIEVLNWGSVSLKAEALAIMEKIFTSREIANLYGPTARIPLSRLTGRSILEDGHLQRRAARVLLLIERGSRSSTSLVAGING